MNSEILDINVTRALSGHTSVDHVDSQLIIAVQGGGAVWREAEVGHDCEYVASILCSGNSSMELRFSGASSSDGLCFASVGDGTAT